MVKNMPCMRVHRSTPSPSSRGYSSWNNPLPVPSVNDLIPDLTPHDSRGQPIFVHALIFQDRPTEVPAAAAAAALTLGHAVDLELDARPIFSAVQLGCQIRIAEHVLVQVRIQATQRDVAMMLGDLQWRSSDGSKRTRSRRWVVCKCTYPSGAKARHIFKLRCLSIAVCQRPTELPDRFPGKLLGVTC